MQNFYVKEEESVPAVPRPKTVSKDKGMMNSEIAKTILAAKLALPFRSNFC